MASTRTALLTPRDLGILQALDRCPLTVLQLLTLSRTFAYPFTTVRRVQERLRVLTESDRVRRWRYATTAQGIPSYFTLSPLGYQLLHGDAESLPAPGLFRPVALARERHTHALAACIVHLAVSAHAEGITLTNFSRENALRLTVGEECLYPDCAFDLLLPAGDSLSFFVEIDQATEQVRSAAKLDSWERKLRFYEAYQDRRDQRFRVLVFTSGSCERLDHILRLAAQLTRNPHRSLVYDARTAAFLSEEHPLTTPCLLDHRGQGVSLIPPYCLAAARVAASLPLPAPVLATPAAV